jgi:hypothetical protein
MRPAPGQTIHDPACGTGGFLLIAHDYVSQHHQLDRDQKKHLKFRALSGNELVEYAATNAENVSVITMQRLWRFGAMVMLAPSGPVRV